MKTFLMKWMKYFLFAGFFSFFVNLLYLTFPIYMLAIYDRVLTSYSMPTLATLTVGAVIALVVLGLLDFFRSRLLVQAGVDMDKTLSRPVLVEMLRDASRIKKVGYTEGLKDINTLRNYFAGNAIFAIFDAPWIPLYLAVLYLMHPVLGIFATAAAILLFLLGLFQEFLTRKRFDQATAINTQEQKFFDAGMRNAEVVNSMNMVPGLTERWKALNDTALGIQTEAHRFAGALSSVSRSFRPAMQVLIFGLGAYLVLQNQSTAGIIIAASIIMRQALNPVEQAMNTWRQTVDARGAYKRLNQLIKSASPPEAMSLPSPAGNLAAEAASLQMDGTQILQNVSFFIGAGEMMGLIGPSGAGKTSLCRLILGVWPPSAGTVRLDGADVYKWDSNDLGPYIGYVPQDIELFPGTISENIARMGEVEPEKVIEAGRLAGIHEMILKLPKGYDTLVGEGGVRLSGGQRQRVGLARAFYGDPRLVVLDEPNSNLDDIGEKALVEALQQLKQKEISTIIVTHKPSLLSHADKVLMLRDGQVSMFGPRQEVFKNLMGPQKGQQQPAGEQPTRG